MKKVIKTSSKIKAASKLDSSKIESIMETIEALCDEYGCDADFANIENGECKILPYWRNIYILVSLFDETEGIFVRTDIATKGGTMNVVEASEYDHFISDMTSLAEVGSLLEGAILEV